MSDGTIAVLVYFAILFLLIFACGVFSERIKNDKEETVIVCIFWPMCIFAFPIFYILRFAYFAGVKSAGKDKNI